MSLGGDPVGAPFKDINTFRSHNFRWMIASHKAAQRCAAFAFYGDKVDQAAQDGLQLVLAVDGRRRTGPITSHSGMEPGQSVYCDPVTTTIMAR